MTQNLGWIHRFIPAQGDDTTTLLLLHGTGGNEDDLLEVGRTLRPGAALLSPRGKVLENGMPRFFRRLAEGVLDIEDLKVRTHELAEFVSAAATAYELDPASIVAVGYSNGANIAASTLLLRPEVLRGAVLFRPMVPLVPDSLPNLDDVSVFIGAARYDQMVKPQESERLAELLRSAGAQVTVEWQPTNHGLTQQDLDLATAWLRDRATAAG